MKMRTRLTMICTLPNGILDSFTVYCTPDKAEIIRQKYKAMGYEVLG